MRFAVPQFIEVEDKIFGPLTLKQAIYLGGGVGVNIALFVLVGLAANLIIGLPIALVSVALAFLRVNNRPFYLMVYAWFFYAVGNKLYLWKKVVASEQHRNTPHIEEDVAAQQAPRLSQSRLKELAWSLDTHESMYTREDQWKQT